MPFVLTQERLKWQQGECLSLKIEAGLQFQCFVASTQGPAPGLAGSLYPTMECEAVCGLVE